MSSQKAMQKSEATVKAIADALRSNATDTGVNTSLSAALLKTDAGKVMAIDAAWKIREIEKARQARYHELRELAYDVFVLVVNRPYIFEASKPVLADMAAGGPDSDQLLSNLRFASTSTRAYLDAVTFLTGADESCVSLPACVVREANRR